MSNQECYNSIKEYVNTLYKIKFEEEKRRALLIYITGYRAGTNKYVSYIAFNNYVDPSKKWDMPYVMFIDGEIVYHNKIEEFFKDSDFVYEIIT